MSPPPENACGVASKTIDSDCKASDENDTSGKIAAPTAAAQEDEKKSTVNAACGNKEEHLTDGKDDPHRTREQHFPDSHGGVDNALQAERSALVASRHDATELPTPSKPEIPSGKIVSSMARGATNSMADCLTEDGTDDQVRTGNNTRDNKPQTTIDTKHVDNLKLIGESSSKEGEIKPLNSNTNVAKPIPVDGGDVKKKSADTRKSSHTDGNGLAGTEATNSSEGRELLARPPLDLSEKQNEDGIGQHQVNDKVKKPISECEGESATDGRCSAVASVAIQSQTNSGVKGRDSPIECIDDAKRRSNEVEGDSVASQLRCSSSPTCTDDQAAPHTEDDCRPRTHDRKGAKVPIAGKDESEVATANVKRGSSTSVSSQHDQTAEDTGHEARRSYQQRQAITDDEANSTAKISAPDQSLETQLHDDYLNLKATARSKGDGFLSGSQEAAASSSINGPNSPVSNQTGTSASVKKKAPPAYRLSDSTPSTSNPSPTTKTSLPGAPPPLVDKYAQSTRATRDPSKPKKRAASVTFAADLVIASPEDKSTTTYDSMTTDDSKSSRGKRKRRRKGSKKRSPRKAKAATGSNMSALAILRASLAASSTDVAKKNSFNSGQGGFDSITKSTSPASSTRDARSPALSTLDNVLQDSSSQNPQENNKKARTIPNKDTANSDKDGASYRGLRGDRTANEVAAKISPRSDDGCAKPAAIAASTRLEDEHTQLPKSLVELASRTPEPIRSEHTRILLNLFVHVDAQRMHELGKECVEMFPELSATLRREHGSKAVFCLSPPDSQTSVLAAMPAALQRFRELSNQRREQYKKPISEDTKKRKGYASRSLQELEDIVSKKFFESQLYKESANLSKKIAQTAAPPSSPNESTATSTTRKNFIPFALEYNESSITAISTWLGKQVHGDKKGNRIDNVGSDSRSNQYDRPTVAPMFRKCSVCKRFGHYEIECNELKEEQILDLARRTRVQATVRELAEKKTLPKSGCFRFYQAVKGSRDERTKELTPEGASPDGFANMRLTCEVCHSGLDDVHMLICDGCDKLFHLFCLDPPLKQVPDGDWFCNECQGHSDAVNSDVEIEACDGFVIEQRKRPRSDRHLREDEGIGFPSDGWQTAIAVIGNDVQVANENVSESPRSKRRRRASAPEEEVEIDGFKIVAKATSDSPHASRRMKAWACSVEDISQDPLVVGSAVAWFPLSESSGDNGGSQDHVTSDPTVGVVLAVESSSRKALVRQVVGWRDVLLDSWTEGTSETPERLEDCSIQALSSGATAWVSVENLHIVGRAPSDGVIKSFRRDILPTRLTNERQSRTDPVNTPESSAAIVKTR